MADGVRSPLRPEDEAAHENLDHRGEAVIHVPWEPEPATDLQVDEAVDGGTEAACGIDGVVTFETETRQGREHGFE